MSVNGILWEHQKVFLKILMDHYDSLKEHLTEIEQSLEADMDPFALQVERLSGIYGISTTASCAIIAEIGIDMKPFKTAEHIQFGIMEVEKGGNCYDCWQIGLLLPMDEEIARQFQALSKKMMEQEGKKHEYL